MRAIAIEFHNDSRRVSSFDRIVANYGFTVSDDGSHTVLAIKLT